MLNYSLSLFSVDLMDVNKQGRAFVRTVFTFFPLICLSSRKLLVVFCCFFSLKWFCFFTFRNVSGFLDKGDCSFEAH